MKYDVIIILGGGIYKNGTLTDSSKLRVEKGVEFFKKNIAPYLIMSGAWSFWLSYKPRKTEAIAMKEYAGLLGISKYNILIEDKSKATIENAYFTKINFIQPRNWKNILIVTSDFHKDKTRYLFKKVLGQEYKIKFEEVKNTLPKLEVKKIKENEKLKLKIFKKLLRKIKSGDDKSIKKLLNRLYKNLKNNKLNLNELKKSL